LKALFPIESTDEGIMAEVNPPHPAKADWPIEVIVVGYVKDVKLFFP
jgi:hypothetical protein